MFSHCFVFRLLLCSLLLCGFVAADTSCVSDYQWLNEACDIQSSLNAACDPSTPSLAIPVVFNQTAYEAANTTCQCNKPYFNLHVGCNLCQNTDSGAQALTWAQWSKPCPFNSTFDKPSTSGVTIPEWALIVSPQPDDTFDVNEAHSLALRDGKPGAWGTFQVLALSITSAIAFLSIFTMLFILYRRKHPYKTVRRDSSHTMIKLPSSSSIRTTPHSTPNDPSVDRVSSLSKFLKRPSGKFFKSRPYKVPTRSDMDDLAGEDEEDAQILLANTQPGEIGEYDGGVRSPDATWRSQQAQQAQMVRSMTPRSPPSQQDINATWRSQQSRHRNGYDNSQTLPPVHAAISRSPPLTQQPSTPNHLRISTDLSRAPAQDPQGGRHARTQSEDQSRTRPSQQLPRRPAASDYFQPRPGAQGQPHSDHMRVSASDLPPITPLPTTPPWG